MPITTPFREKKGKMEHNQGFIENSNTFGHKYIQNKFSNLKKKKKDSASHCLHGMPRNGTRTVV